MEHRCSSNTPLNIYHGVPVGWSKEEILNRYADLGGKSSIEPSEATEPGAPSWLPDRRNWLQYRATLYKIASGLRGNDSACIELAIQYIELDYFGSYSGFIRERFARLLKNNKLSCSQATRLKRHFQALRNNRTFLQEFREYKKLEERITNVWPEA